MTHEEMEKLMKERILLKQLISVNPSYREIFGPRIKGIKMKINSEYSHLTINPENAFPLFSVELSKKITESAIEHIRELQRNTN